GGGGAGVGTAGDGGVHPGSAGLGLLLGEHLHGRGLAARGPPVDHLGLILLSIRRHAGRPYERERRQAKLEFHVRPACSLFYRVCNRLHFWLRCHRRRRSQPFIESMARETVTAGGWLLAAMGQKQTQRSTDT